MAGKKKNKTSGGKGGGTRRDQYQAQPGHAGVQRSDLALTRRSMRDVPSSIPKQISSQIVYDVVRLQQIVVTSLTLNVEQNFAFNFASHPESAQWAALFDQWCIPQVAVTFTSTEPPGSLGQSPVLTTAIDFDNTTSLGLSTTLLMEFENSQVVTLSPGMSHTRACRPCLKPTVSGGTGVDRMWCDSAGTGSTWNGIRMIANTTAVSTTSILCQQTLWFAFRNGI